MYDSLLMRESTDGLNGENMPFALIYFASLLYNEKRSFYIPSMANQAGHYEDQNALHLYRKQRV